MPLLSCNCSCWSHQFYSNPSTTEIARELVCSIIGGVSAIPRWAADMDIMGHLWAGTGTLPVLDHSWCCPSQGHISSAQTHCFASLPLTQRGALTDLLGQITLSEQIMCDHAPPRETYTSGFVNTNTHRINSLVFQLREAYSIILLWKSKGLNHSKH